MCRKCKGLKTKLKILEKEVNANGRKSLREIQASQGTMIKINLYLNLAIIGMLGTFIGLIVSASA